MLIILQAAPVSVTAIFTEEGKLETILVDTFD